MITKIIGIVLVCVLACPTIGVAETPDPDADEKEQDVDPKYKNSNYFAVMMKAFLAELAKEAAGKAVAKVGQPVATDAMKKQLNALGWAMAAWGFYQGAREFKKSKTESDRYHASMSAASAVVAVVPGWGTLVSGLMTVHNIKSRMIGTWYVKDKIKDALRTQLEVIRIFNGILKNERRVAKAEEDALTQLFMEFLFADYLATKSLEEYQAKCVKIGSVPYNANLEEIFKPYDECVQISVNVVTSQELFIATYRDLLSFPASHVITEKFLDVKAGESKEKLMENLNRAQRDLQTVRSQMTERIRELNVLKASMIKSAINESEEIQSGRRQLLCRKTLSENGLRVIEAGKDSGRLGPARLLAAVEDYKFYRDEFCKDIRFDAAAGGMERLNRLVDAFERSVPRGN